MRKLIISFTIIISFFVVASIVTSNVMRSSAKENSAFSRSEPRTIIKTQDVITKINNQEQVLVYFFSPDCSHCKSTTLIMNRLSKEFNIYKVNLNEHEELWDKYKIIGTPTVINFQSGKEKNRFIGEHSEEQYRSWISSLNIK
ncbi:thioredoxin [Bacillus salipaludis]|uniref:Thioredoxin n=1 Tax=Bacillus salipaludis TaxID=2547811 RepID=A0A4R5VID7_9BACI|nr:thioredoxin family protein [Bacillus salipaludis]TDK54763.1 thioredoxin [Bacillus salipaludis]